MDGSEGTAVAGEADTGFVSEIGAIGRTVISGAEHAAAHLEQRVADIVDGAKADALDAITALGDVHLTIGRLNMNDEIGAAQAHVEAAIVAIARDLGLAATG